MGTLLERTKALMEKYEGVKKIAVSYSGGLDSVVISSLLSKSGFEVLPVVIDLGQESDFGRIEKNAKSMFDSCATVDYREKFAHNISRGIKANCYFKGHVNFGGLSRPVLALALANEARKNKCQAIAHGASGIGNDQLTIGNSLCVLAPEMRIIAPVRDLDMKREESLAFAAEQKLITNLPRAQQFSADENLWARSIRQGFALDPSQPVSEEAYKWTVSPQRAPDSAEEVEIELHDGVPVAATIGGERTEGLVAIIEKLNEVGGKHGIGRRDAMDDKAVGLKTREILECPGAMILLRAHQKIEALTLTSKELEAKRIIDSMWNQLVHDGFWYSRLRRCLDAFIDETQRVVSGEARMQLYKGNIIIQGRKSKYAIYNMRLSGRNKQGMFSQKDARRFAKLYGLQDIIAFLIDGE